MSYNYRIAAVAFGLALSFGALAQEEASQAPIEQSPAQQQPAIEPEPVGPVVSPVVPTGGEHGRAATENAGGETEQNGYLILGDGWAQWVMALTGVGALILSALAVWLLKKTLEATRLAATHAEGVLDEARRTTSAAEATVAETKRIGEAQTSAYLYVDDTDCGQLALGEEAVTVSINIRNYGQSPAKNVFVEIECSIRPRWRGGKLSGVHPIVISKKRAVRKAIVQTAIRSSFFFHWANDLFGKENIALIRSGSYQVVISYWVRWETEFNKVVPPINSEISTQYGFVSDAPYEAGRKIYPLYPRDPQQ